MQNVNYRKNLNEHRGAHLIFYLSERVLIGGSAHLNQGAQLKKRKVGTS